MRDLSIILLLTLLPVFHTYAQSERKNHKPKIVGQSELVTNEDVPLTIELSHLRVEDRDNWWYPWGFTMRIYEGNNYTFNNQTITPAANFSGTLSVRVTVNDGEDDSPPYDVQIAVRSVNDVPVITGQHPVTTEHNTAITIRPDHLIVNDPDNNFPADFSVAVAPSSNNSYSVSGTTVTPAPGFEGMLSVTVRVSDGASYSQPFSLQIKVNPGNRIPVIVSQTPLSTEEEQPLALQLSHLSVRDEDNAYPSGFSLKILPGNNYSSANNTVTPARDFAGVLTVNVVVSDGKSDSAPYALKISVNPVNDAPVITALEEEELPYTPTDGMVAISQELMIEDVDNDSLESAEIRLKAETFLPGVDELLFESTSLIKGTFDKERGTLKLAGRAPVGDYVMAIRNVRYRYLKDFAPEFKARLLTINVYDGAAASETRERQIGAGTINFDLDIPTAFTPNGDAANDTWEIRTRKHSDEANKAVVRVYNRNGYLVFEAVGFEKPWDGRLNGQPLPADTYYYTIDLGPNNSDVMVKGIVTILR